MNANEMTARAPICLFSVYFILIERKHGIGSTELWRLEIVTIVMQCNRQAQTPCLMLFNFFLAFPRNVVEEGSSGFPVLENKSPLIHLVATLLCHLSVLLRE